MYVLDTTVLSGLMRSDASTAERLLQTEPEQVRVPQPVVAEIEYGLARLPRSKRRQALEERLSILLRSLTRLPWNDDVSKTFGALKAVLEKSGTRVDDFDVAIAAHAVAFDATLVTENLRHFQRIHGLSVESWGAARPG
jgi:tRNA(fMet)-specific endonuclease VapC